MSRTIKEAHKKEERAISDGAKNLGERGIEESSACLQSNISLGDLLELFDGLVETPGRVVIMTTNHPELLDPALLRPGRLDMVIEFKKLTKENVSNYYKTWFGVDIPQEVYVNMKDRSFSQADIGNMFTGGDFEKIHKVLME